jgi:hypothetical protein
MPAKDDDQSVVDSERQVLRALCQGALDTRSNLNTLRSYRWCDSVHQAIFDFLISRPAASAELIREQLPAHLTRRGFPDFDLSWFRTEIPAEEDVEMLIQRLRARATPFEDPLEG